MRTRLFYLIAAVILCVSFFSRVLIFAQEPVLQTGKNISNDEITWITPTLVSSGEIYGPMAEYPVVAMDGQDNTHVAWFSSYGSDSETLQYALKPFNGNWTNPEEVYNLEQGRGRPAIVAGNAETVHLAWRNRDKGHYAGLDYSYKTGMGSWAQRYEFNTPWHVNWPVLTMDDSGNLYILWTDLSHTPGASKILYTTKPNGENWTPPTEIYSNNKNTFLSALAVDTNGAVHAAWENETDNGWAIYYAVKPNGGKWSAPVAMPDTTIYPGAGLDIAVDTNNMVHLVWADFSGDWSKIYYAAKPVNGSWSAPLDISNEFPPYIWPRIAIDLQNNNIYVVWMQDSGSMYLHYATKTPNEDWSKPKYLMDGGRPSIFPDIAIDSKGDIHLVLQRDNAIYHTVGVTPKIPHLNNLSPLCEVKTGDTMTLLGKNFGNAPGNVMFGSAPALTITTWVDTQIVVSVPANAGKQVAVKTSEGESNELTYFTEVCQNVYLPVVTRNY